jgi:hypothetical protein
MTRPYTSHYMAAVAPLARITVETALDSSAPSRVALILVSGWPDHECPSVGPGCGGFANGQPLLLRLSDSGLVSGEILRDSPVRARLPQWQLRNNVPDHTSGLLLLTVLVGLTCLRRGLPPPKRERIL